MPVRRSLVSTDSRDDGRLTEALDYRTKILSVLYGHLPARQLLARLIRREFPGRLALVSSFGAESAVLLHMVARIDQTTPVVFLDTAKLFGETLGYRDRLIGRLGLTDVRTVGPDPDRVRAADSADELWRRDPDRCCLIRKVEPLRRALSGFDAWITGRKTYQGGLRKRLVVFEAVEGRIKVNPLAAWRKSDLEDYFVAHDLPRHPLEADGFLSIGCLPCTDRVTANAEPRDGRWRGSRKTECGIHRPTPPPQAPPQ